MQFKITIEQADKVKEINTFNQLMEKQPQVPEAEDQGQSSEEVLDPVNQADEDQKTSE